MSEILSQAEIDALLSALQSGEVDVEAIRQEENTRKVRVYDFRRPNKFSKDQLHTLEVIFDNFSRLLTTLLSGNLRTRVLVKVASVEQVTYEEFTRSIPNPTILNIFSLPPLEGKGILEINPVIGFSIIDRLFGGPGLSTIKGRPLTEIEKTVMEKTVEKILALFEEAWSSLISVQAWPENMEINPQFTQIVSPLEMVVIVTLNTQVGDTEGFINICLPCLMLENIAGKLNTKFWFGSAAKEQTPENFNYLNKLIQKANVPLTAILGRTPIMLQELLDLQVGDVINLEHKKDGEIGIYIGSRLKYQGKPGLAGSKLAVQITKICQEGSEENE